MTTPAPPPLRSSIIERTAPIKRRAPRADKAHERLRQMPREESGMRNALTWIAALLVVMGVTG